MQREKNNNFILDFTGVYDDEFAKEKTSLTWIDCTDITGCDMYVSDEAEKQIGERVDSVGIHGIHFLDSGMVTQCRSTLHFLYIIRNMQKQLIL